MADNTTDKQIPNPDKPDELIDNPNYAKPQEKPAATPKELDLTTPAEDYSIQIGKTGNARIDGVSELLTEKKVPNANIIIEDFAKTGELSLANQAALVDSLGDSLAQLAITQLQNEAKDLQAASTAARTETLDYMKTAFGETDANATWDAVKEFVDNPSSGFSTDDKAELTKMLQKGGLAARLAIDNIKAVYEGNPNTTINADLLNGDTNTTTGFTPISAKAYAEKVNELTNKYGYDSTEVKQLQQQRERSRNAGIA